MNKTYMVFWNIITPKGNTGHRGKKFINDFESAKKMYHSLKRKEGKEGGPIEGSVEIVEWEDSILGMREVDEELLNEECTQVSNANAGKVDLFTNNVNTDEDFYNKLLKLDDYE